MRERVSERVRERERDAEREGAIYQRRKKKSNNENIHPHNFINIVGHKPIRQKEIKVNSEILLIL